MREGTAPLIRRAISKPCGLSCMGSSLNSDQRIIDG